MKSSFEPSHLFRANPSFEPSFSPHHANHAAEAEQASIEEERERERAALRAEIRAELEAENQQKLDGALTALGEVAAQWRQLEAEELAGFQRGVVELALTIAGRVLRKELDRDSEAMVPWIEEALDELMAPSGARIILSPLDLPLYEDGVSARLRALAESWSAVVETDATLATGECRVIAGEARVDLRLDAILARFREQLIEDAGAPGAKS